MISHSTKARAEEVPSIRVVDSGNAIRRVACEALQAARRNASVLITGERGAGQEDVARFIHRHSDRSMREFAAIHCDELTDLRIESALFGQAQGSFAGADRDKPGALESVRGGTVFLEDIDALSAGTQARLLRFLQTGEYLRIGGNPARIQPRPGVRVMASTTANLQASVNAGLFLDDLYRWLSAIRLSLPPLRERRHLMPSLVDHFADQLVEPEGGKYQSFGLCGQDGGSSPAVQ